MDGYPLQPFNLSGNQTDGGTGGDSAVDDGEPFAQVGDLEARCMRSPARNTNAPKRCSRTHPT